jgi:hypothetical protein
MCVRPRLLCRNINAGGDDDRQDVILRIELDALVCRQSEHWEVDALRELEKRAQERCAN